LTKHLTLLLLIGFAWGQNPCEDNKYQELLNIYNFNDSSWDKVSISDKRYFAKINVECAKAKKIKKTEQISTSPCDDRRYNEIKQKDLDEMSDREYDYFMLKEKQCSDFDVSLKSVDRKKKSSFRKKEVYKDDIDVYIYSFTLPDGSIDIKSYNRALAKKERITIKSTPKKTNKVYRKSIYSKNKNNTLLNESEKQDLNNAINAIEGLFNDEVQNLYSERRCEYDGERLSTIGSKTKLTGDGKLVKGLKCLSCGRVRYFPD